MDKFVLITHEKMRFLLNRDEYKIYTNAVKVKAKFVTIQGSFIPLQILPSVFPFGVWYTNENERLANSGKRLCKLCLSIMEGDCKCWDGKTKKNAFIPPELPNNVKLLLVDAIKSFPKVTKEEIEEENLKENFLLN